MTPNEMAQTHAAAFQAQRPWSEAEFTDLLANPFTQVFGDTRCFALVQIIADEAELLTIATHPRHQRQGLAQRCMAEWHNAAQTRGATRAFLDVAADNHPALALYKACGYTSCGLRKGYYQGKSGQKTDAIVMECLLTSA